MQRNDSRSPKAIECGHEWQPVQRRNAVQFLPIAPSTGHAAEHFLEFMNEICRAARTVTVTEP